MLKMTDQDHQESLENQNEEQAPTTSSQDSLELQYPQLLLEASLQSLLTHSYSSSPSASTVVNMPRSEISLQDSFIHIDEHDTDDDTQSEVTDLSLLSRSTHGGARTPREDRETCDTEDEEGPDDGHAMLDEETGQEIEENYTIVHRSSAASDSPVSTPLIRSAETIMSDETVQATKRQRDLEWICSLGTRDLEGGAMLERLIPSNRPFRVLCCPSPAVSAETKNEVLSKIGSVLVGLYSSSKILSPYYSVVPTEFGPGAKPDTADLIPIPVQMVVHECHIPTTTTAEQDLHLCLVDGAHISSDGADRVEIEDADGNWHQPDLLLILTSDLDDQYFMEYLDALLVKTKAHLVPLIVRQESDMVDRPSQIDLQRLVAMNFEAMRSYLRSIIDASIIAHNRTTHVPQINLPQNGAFTWLFAWFTSNSLTAGARDNTRQIEPILVRMPSEMTTNLPDPVPRGVDRSSYVGSFLWRRSVLSNTAVSVCGIFALSALLAFMLRLISGPGSLTIGESYRPTERCSGIPSSTTAVASFQLSSSTQQAIPSHVSNLEQIAQMLAPVKQPETDVMVLEEKTLQRVRPFGGRLRHQSIVERCPAGKTKVFDGKGNDIVVPQDFLSPNGTLLPVTVSVTNRGNRVNFASVSTRAGFDIQLDEDDLHGVIDLSLRPSDSDSRLCAQIDLRDSISEIMAAGSKSHVPWAKLGRDNKKLKLSLVHIRTPDWSDRGLFGQLKGAALNPLYAMENVIEKSLVRQVRACSEGQKECITYRIQEYRDDLLSRQVLASQRARNVIDSSLDRAAARMEALHKAIPNLPTLFKNQQDKLIQTAAESQSRARQLVDRIRNRKRQH